jgi:poly-gamma-glutamate synthesis protein (capsule biosynthesis protein)
MIKISFLGDIMCEKPFLKAAIKRGFDFYTAFSNLNSFLSEADYVVANLETPIAGKDYKFTDKIYSFNTPEEFLDSLKKIKIDLYLTANNHCLDRGINGLNITLDELDKRNMAHTGTFRSKEEQKNIFIHNFGGLKCAFVSCNAYINRDNWLKFRKELSPYCINSLIDMDSLINYRAKSIPFYYLRTKFSNGFISDFRVYLRRMFAQKPKPHTDNEHLLEIQGNVLENIRDHIEAAKNNADLVFLLPHCGGQFNVQPGVTSIELFNKLFEFGADAVIASHPHVIQKITFNDNKPCVFSLGNVSMSPSSPYIVESSLPQYGLIYNVYIDNKAIVKTSFSIIKMVEESDHYPLVFLTDVLYEKSNCKQKELIKNDISHLYQRITGNNSFPGIQREYPLKQLQ